MKNIDFGTVRSILERSNSIRAYFTSICELIERAIMRFSTRIKLISEVNTSTPGVVVSLSAMIKFNVAKFMLIVSKVKLIVANIKSIFEALN
jgi:hypothetical protein